MMQPKPENHPTKAQVIQVLYIYIHTHNAQEDLNGMFCATILHEFAYSFYHNMNWLPHVYWFVQHLLDVYGWLNDAFVFLFHRLNFWSTFE